MAGVSARRLASSARRLVHRDIARDTAWALALQLLTIVVSLLSFTLLGRRLGPEFVGTYAGIYAMLGPLIGLSYGCKLLYLQITKDDQRDLAVVAGRCIGLLLVAGVVLVGVVLAIAPFVVEGVALWTIAALAAMELLGHVVGGVVAAYVWTMDGFVASARIEMTQAVSRVIPVVALAAVDRLTLGTLAIASFAVTAAWLAVLFPWVDRRYGATLRPRRPSFALARSSATFSVGITATGLQNDADKGFMNANNHVLDTGYYSAAYRIVQMGFLPVTALIGSSHRRFLEPDGGVLGAHRRRAMRFALPVVAYSTVVAAALWLVAPAVPLLLGDAFEPSVTMLRWLVLFLPLRASWGIAINALLGLDRPGLRTLVLVVSAMLSLSLYAILIPEHSWAGAVVATVVSELTLAVLCWTLVVVAQRRRDRDLRRHPGQIDDRAVEEAVT